MGAAICDGTIGRTRTKTVKKPAVETGSELSTISIYFNISYSFLQFYLFLPAMLFNNHMIKTLQPPEGGKVAPETIAGGLKHDSQPVSTGNVGDILFGDDSSIKKTGVGKCPMTWEYKGHHQT